MSKKIGDWGEKLAAAYLGEKGIQILHTNWRSSRCELDLVGMDSQTLVFFEVKVRVHGSPVDIHGAITDEKMRRLSRAASAYMRTYHLSGEVRFDLIGITYYDKSNYKIEHKKDTFFPGHIM